MNNFVFKEIKNKDLNKELDLIGFDKAYQLKFQDKMNYKNIKIFNLNLAQANILKQTALIFGADCAINRNVIIGNIEKSDVILCGSISQLRKISEKLISQPFKLKILAEQILDLLDNQTRNKTKLVGILNITPDSFSDGGLYLNKDLAIKHLLTLIEEGADIIDIGAESTRPYSTSVDTNTQIERLKPVLTFIQKENLKLEISVDTRDSNVADFALNNGVEIINDVSGFDFDNKMPDIIKKYDANIIIQHSKGDPSSMQNNPHYNNLIEDIFFNLKNKIELAEEKGIKNIVIDPGIGFGKTREHNLEILNRIEEFYSLKKPIMVGLSRKSFLGNFDNNQDKDALSLALSYPLIKSGVDYLRVHNVKLHKNILNLI